MVDNRSPGPEAMLGVWTSWVAAASKLSDTQGPAAAILEQMSWPMTQNLFGAGLLEGGLREFGEWLAKDPILLTSESALNANPLRQVIPVDWAEIARALRTVWLHRLSRPETAIVAATDFNRKLWKSAFDTWSDTAQRWWGVARSDADRRPGGQTCWGRQAFRRAGVAIQPVLSHPEGTLLPGIRLAAPTALRN